MMGESDQIDWRNMLVAVPAFLTIVVQPFTFSIANGIYAGGCSGVCDCSRQRGGSATAARCLVARDSSQLILAPARRCRCSS